MKNSTKIYSLLSLLFCIAINPIAQGYTENKNTLKGEQAHLAAQASSALQVAKNKAQYQTQYASIYKAEDGAYFKGSGLMLLGFLAFVGLGLFYYLFLLIIDVNKTYAKLKEQTEELRNLKRVGGSYSQFKMELS